LLLLSGLVRSGHRHVEAWAPREAVTEAIRFLPSGKALGVVAMGYEEVLADLLWVRATVLFGDRFGLDEDPGWYTWMYYMVDLATDLDPGFVLAYKYGGIMLRADGQFVDQSTLLFAKGMEAVPEEWYFPFGIAMNYFLHKDSRRLAAPYMQRAASLGTGPFYLTNLAASLMDESQELETTLAFLEEEKANLQDERILGAVDAKIFETRYQIAERDAQRVIGEYRRMKGELPSTPEAVGEAGLSLPQDPLGGTWVWNQELDAELGSVHSSAYYRAFAELAKRTGLGAQTPDSTDVVGVGRGDAPAPEPQ